VQDMEQADVASMRIAATVDMDLLTAERALELSCWHAFGRVTVPQGKEGQQVRQVVGMCGGLPMAVEVVGRHLKNCESARRCVEDISAALLVVYNQEEALGQQRALFTVLRLSWEGLHDPTWKEYILLIQLVWLIGVGMDFALLLTKGRGGLITGIH
jgi:hypothetical protein